MSTAKLRNDDDRTESLGDEVSRTADTVVPLYHGAGDPPARRLGRADPVFRRSDPGGQPPKRARPDAAAGTEANAGDDGIVAAPARRGSARLIRRRVGLGLTLVVIGGVTVGALLIKPRSVDQLSNAVSADVAALVARGDRLSAEAARSIEAMLADLVGIARLLVARVPDPSTPDGHEEMSRSGGPATPGDRAVGRLPEWAPPAASDPAMVADLATSDRPVRDDLEPEAVLRFIQGIVDPPPVRRPLPTRPALVADGWVDVLIVQAAAPSPSSPRKKAPTAAPPSTPATASPAPTQAPAPAPAPAAAQPSALAPPPGPGHPVGPTRLTLEAALARSFGAPEQAPRAGPVEIDRVEGAFVPDLAVADPDRAGEAGLAGVEIMVEHDQPVLNRKAEFLDAHAAMVAGQPERAIDHYRRILAHTPSDADAMFGLATALHRAGDTVAALVAYEELLALDPWHKAGLTNLMVLISEQRPRDAIVRLERIGRDIPTFGPVWVHLGHIYANLGDLPRAIANLQRAVTLEPDNAFFRYNLAVLYDRAGYRQQALTAYRHLLRAAPRGGYQSRSLPIAQVRARVRFLGQPQP